VRVILHAGPSRLGRLWVRCRLRVGHAEVILPPSVGGAVLVPAFSAADGAVALVPTAALVTSAVETAGDYSTGVSFALIPNASRPEAFLPLSDVVGGALHTSKRPQ
jgi:hypothetical protein